MCIRDSCEVLPRGDRTRACRHLGSGLHCGEWTVEGVRVDGRVDGRGERRDDSQGSGATTVNVIGRPRGR
eukprot:688480-Pyramimonas_sp.AAC.1